MTRMKERMGVERYSWLSQINAVIEGLEENVWQYKKKLDQKVKERNYVLRIWGLECSSEEELVEPDGEEIQHPIPMMMEQEESAQESSSSEEESSSEEGSFSEKESSSENRQREVFRESSPEMVVPVEMKKAEDWIPGEYNKEKKEQVIWQNRRWRIRYLIEAERDVEGRRRRERMAEKKTRKSIRSREIHKFYECKRFGGES